MKITLTEYGLTVKIITTEELEKDISKRLEKAMKIYRDNPSFTSISKKHFIQVINAWATVNQSN